ARRSGVGMEGVPASDGVGGLGAQPRSHRPASEVRERARRSGVGMEGVPASDGVGGLGAKPRSCRPASELRERARRSGVGMEGVPASDGVGGLGAKPPDQELEAPPGFEPGVEVLQTSALPLGDGALRTRVRKEEAGEPRLPIRTRGPGVRNLRERWSGKRDSNPRLRPWQGRTLPLSYSRPRQLLEFTQTRASEAT